MNHLHREQEDLLASDFGPKQCFSRTRGCLGHKYGGKVTWMLLVLPLTLFLVLLPVSGPNPDETYRHESR